MNYMWLYQNLKNVNNDTLKEIHNYWYYLSPILIIQIKTKQNLNEHLKMFIIFIEKSSTFERFL